MVFQTFRFFAGNLNHRTMLGRLEVGSLHHAFVEVSQIGEMNEVGRFGETEVAGADAVDVVH